MSRRALLSGLIGGGALWALCGSLVVVYGWSGVVLWLALLIVLGVAMPFCAQVIA